MQESVDSQPSLRHHGMQLLRECPLCTAAYRDEDVSLISEADGAQLLHVTCAKCQGALLAYLLHSTFGMSTIAMVSDLSAQDAERFIGSAALSDDELLSFHRFLTTHPKRFIQMFVS